MVAVTSSFGSSASSLNNIFGVSGSGDAKISASTMAFSELSMLCGGPVWPGGLFLGISDRMRRIRGTRALVNANRSRSARLEHANQLQPDHLEGREERDNPEAGRAVGIGEQVTGT